MLNPARAAFEAMGQKYQYLCIAIMRPCAYTALDPVVGAGTTQDHIIIYVNGLKDEQLARDAADGVGQGGGAPEVEGGDAAWGEEPRDVT
jgi:hypothetical protein